MIGNNRLAKWLINMVARIRYDVRVGSGSQICRHSVFEGKNAIFENTEISCSHIGFGSYVANESKIRNAKIGKFCSIGDGVRTCLGLHPSRDFVSTHPAFFSIADPAGLSYLPIQRFEEHRFVDKQKNFVVYIGNDVWVGNNVQIFDGVNIGDGAIIGAGSVVTKNVAPYTIVAGVPATPLRKRFTDEQVEKLLQECWWDWSHERISKNAVFFSSIDEFLEQCHAYRSNLK
jgi:acetyltransferase-like isoleucine patch superfamily enzyme